MKKKVYFLILIGLLLGCEDVIDVEVPTEDPRLIVNAVFKVDIADPWVPVEVKVSLTNNFFGEIPVTQLENIVILYEEFDENGLFLGGGSSTLAEVAPGTGIYEPDPNTSREERISTSTLRENMTFAMIIRHEGRRYIAQTRYVPAVPIQSLRQGTSSLFNGDEAEIIVTIQDDPERTNFYIFDFGAGNFLVTEDQFYNGQIFEFSYFLEKVEAGQEIRVSILGADRTFYNYMNLLMTQSDNTFGFFQTPVSTIRGNFFDITNLNNIDVFDNVNEPNIFPLGYFAIVQTFSQTITIED